VDAFHSRGPVASDQISGFPRGRDRLQMADGLVALRMLNGKSREQLVEMLGELMKPDYFDEWEMVYWLGPERRTFSLDSEWLVINLDAEGSVSDYRAIHD